MRGFCLISLDMSRPDEIYVSTDVEANGPFPGPHSMLSFASVAMLPDETVLGEFTVNLTELPETVPHPVTMKWWEDFPEAYAASRTNQESTEDAMPRYAAWLNDLPARPVFVAHPVAWDFGWIYSYLLRFHGTCPFGHSGLDIKTLAMAALDIPYRNCMKSNFPSSWLDEEDRHTHVALDDAREQGVLFCRALNHLRASQSQVVDPEPVGE